MLFLRLRRQGFPDEVHGSFTARIAGDGDWADFRLTAPPGTPLDINGRKICEVRRGAPGQQRGPAGSDVQEANPCRGSN